MVTLYHFLIYLYAGKGETQDGIFLFYGLHSLVAYLLSQLRIAYQTIQMAIKLFSGVPGKAVFPILNDITQTVILFA